MNNLPEIFETYPSVYSVGDRYIIITAVKAPCTMWVKVGDCEFFDDSNGILRTSSLTHKIEIPASLLNETREYTLYFREVIERKPYFSQLSEVQSYSSSFRPLPRENIRIFHIADAHNRIDGPVAAAKHAGEHDLLVLNGDIPNHSGDIKYFAAIHCIAGEITQGTYPVIFSRGNHDMRGVCAELLADHTPTDNGKSYYSVKLGSVWALILDCGEDKPDTNDEYGHTICCADFRKRQTDFLDNVIKNCENEYLAEEVKYRLIISHIPFSLHYNPPFNIEEDRYADWCLKIKENIKPNLMLAGHIHNCKILTPEDDDSHPSVVVSASKPFKGSDNIICGSIHLNGNSATIRFIDAEGTIHGEQTVEI